MPQIKWFKKKQIKNIQNIQQITDESLCIFILMTVHIKRDIGVKLSCRKLKSVCEYARRL